MSDIRSSIAPEIKNRIKGGVAIIGVGNIIRGDDGIGPKFIAMLREKKVKAHLFDGGTVPENYIFPILSTSSDTLIIVDAADMGVKPGDAGTFDLEKISNVSFSTHSPSPRLFTDLLKTGKESINIFVVAVQPKRTVLGDKLSSEVEAGLCKLADAFCEALGVVEDGK